MNINKDNNENYNIQTIFLLLNTEDNNKTTNKNGDFKSLISYDLNNIINFQNDETIEKITLQIPYVIIPNSCYNINEYNNNLQIIYSTASYLNINFPYGNYNYSTFITKFKELLPSHFNITFDILTNKFTILNADFPFRILEESTIDYIMGFSGEQFSTLENPPYNIAMPRMCCFLPNPIFNITCNKIYNSNNLLRSDILCSIPNNAKLNGELICQNPIDEYVLNSRDNNNILVLSILNSRNQIINFNGISSYFSLCFKIYRKNNIINYSFNDILMKSTNSNLNLKNIEYKEYLE